MSKTNCVNCGSAKDTSEIKCPFCGTTYLDFTAIDFSSGDPVVCQFILPYSDNVRLSMLAIPRLKRINIDYSDCTTLYADGMAVSHVYNSSPIPEFDISFIPIADKNDHLFSLATNRKEN